MQNVVPPGCKHTSCWFEHAAELRQVPPRQTSCSPHVCPQLPQFALSLAIVAQYGALPSAAQRICPPGQPEVERHPPIEQTRPGPHTLLHEPQLPLSVWRSAQYGPPPSCMQRLWPTAHSDPQLPPEQTCAAPHVWPQPPQLALSLDRFAQ